MKLRMKTDAHHRINSSVSQAYRAGRTYQVPQAIGDALVKRDVADVVGGNKPLKEKDK